MAIIQWAERWIHALVVQVSNHGVATTLPVTQPLPWLGSHVQLLVPVSPEKYFILQIFITNTTNISCPELYSRQRVEATAQRLPDRIPP